MEKMTMAIAAEMSILSRIVRPDAADMSVTAAKALLKLHFDESDRVRMRELLAKNKEGTLTASEREDVQAYELVGHLLDLLHSKTRHCLKTSKR